MTPLEVAGVETFNLSAGKNVKPWWKKGLENIYAKVRSLKRRIAVTYLDPYRFGFFWFFLTHWPQKAIFITFNSLTRLVCNY